MRLLDHLDSRDIITEALASMIEEWQGWPALSMLVAKISKIEGRPTVRAVRKRSAGLPKAISTCQRQQTSKAQVTPDMVRPAQLGAMQWKSELYFDI